MSVKPAIPFKPGEVDYWLIYVRNVFRSAWVPQLTYSKPGTPAFVEEGIKALLCPIKTLVPIEHEGKSLKELAALFPPPAYVSTLDT